MNNGMSEAGSIGPRSKYQQNTGYSIVPVAHWDFTEPQLIF